MMTDKNARKGKNKAAPKDVDGKAAWARLTASAKPLTGETRNRHLPEKSAGLENTPKSRSDASAPVKQPTQGTSALMPKASPAKSSPAKSPPAKSPPVRPTPQGDLQLRTRRRLSRGTISLDGKLDLHGLTLLEAEAALARFVARAQTQHHIWLLVVTGKGTGGEGKLRRALPEWLDRGALAGRVVEYGPAAPNHGGGGAFYLRLRRMKASS